MKRIKCLFIVSGLLALVSACVPQEKRITASDLLLVYSGGEGCSGWDEDHMMDYVRYTDKEGNCHWLFDGFLFLCLRDEDGDEPDVTFCWSKTLRSASRRNWENMLAYWFRDDHCIGALERCISETARVLGKAPYKREVVLAIPYPSQYLYQGKEGTDTVYWGEIDGRELDFSNVEDRFAACKWYIDRSIEEFESHNYKNVDLTGFYWIHEETYGTDAQLISMVSGYLHSLGYPLSWIPWFHAPGYEKWRDLGFDNCWQQPNYYFHDYNPYECLSIVCEEGKATGMGVEMEFDETAMEKPAWGEPNAAYLRDYMKAFKEYGAWEGLPVAYYQSYMALRDLKVSDSPADNELYHEFCSWVVSRPYRNRTGLR